MIELITGTPGAGKTTYAVATRLAVECKRQITLDTDTCLKLGLEVGTTVRRRLVVAGVRGLNLEHERLPHLLTKDSTSNKEVEEWNSMRPDAADEPKHGRLPDQPPVDVPAIMQNWWLWCKPGDLIVIDEAQFVMPRGSMGRKPPYWLQAMEIHRHYGVDFLIITQHPQLIDTTVRALVGLHRHIRSVMGSSVCMVYTWDHASNPERYNMASKATFVRRASHFKLFHSSVAHVKPPTSGRWGLIAAPVLLAIGLGGLAFKLQALGVEDTKAKAGETPPGAVVQASAGRGQSTTARPVGWRDVPKLSGCYAYADQCRCIDERGRPVRIERSMCVRSSSSYDGLVEYAPRVAPPVAASAPASPSLFSQAPASPAPAGAVQ